MADELRFLCDDARHMVCVPYSVANLHRMAEALDVRRCWFHASSRFPHYDMPKRRIAELMAKCELVSSREIVAVAKAAQEEQSGTSELVNTPA